jgi:hypothetical protein
MKQPSAVHLITYGNHVYAKSRERVFSEAMISGWFDSITPYEPHMVRHETSRRFESVLKETRGGGYWVWKFDIIKQHLNKIKENDILIYMDAGCHINPQGVSRFRQYINMLHHDEHSSNIAFQLVHPERQYTTKRLLDHFTIDIDHPDACSGQMMSTLIIMKNVSASHDMIDHAFATIHTDPLLITDHYNSDSDNHHTFTENRHDQSILSLVRKSMPESTIVLPDETYLEQPFGHPDTLQLPFWATRIR